MDELEILAAKLDKLPVDPAARLSYDLFAGGLVWSDERPAFDEAVGADGVPRWVGLGPLRALLYHRSKLIVGASGERFGEMWARAIRLCPNWPGFLPQRRDPALAGKYNTMSEASLRSWEEADARFEQQRSQQSKKATA
jgi:hypothetical protein